MTKQNESFADFDKIIDNLDRALLGRIYERDAEVERAFGHPKKLVSYIVRRKGVETIRKALVPCDDWMDALSDATLYKVAEALSTRPNPGNPGTTRRNVKHHDAALKALELVAKGLGRRRAAERACEDIGVPEDEIHHVEQRMMERWRLKGSNSNS